VRRPPRLPGFGLLAATLVVALTSSGCGPAEVSPEPAAAPASARSAGPPSAAAPPTAAPDPLAPAATERPGALATAAGCVTLRETKVLERLFEGLDAPPRLVGSDGLTPAGQHVADTLANVADEGLDPAPYALDRLPPLAEAYAKARAAVVAQPTSEADRKALATARGCWEVALFDALAAYLRDGRLGNPATAEREAIKALAAVEASDEADGEPEERGGGNSERPGEATLPPFTVPPGTPLPLVLQDRTAYVTTQIADALRAAPDADSMDTLIRGAQPPHPQFAPLRAALGRYRALEKSGGFAAVPARGTIKPDATNAAVRALQARLAQESMYAGEPTGTYDAATRAAVERFQTARQLVVSGEPDAAFWRALDVPLAKRIQTLEIALGRVRRSRIDLDKTFVQVLIPDFHLEFWADGKRVARHRVIVGKPREKKCDEKTATMTLAYATPVQSAEIKRVVMAPYWNVTRTIKEQELDPQQAANPLYYATHGYEVLRAGEPRESVRELPRPGNSLGFVKFLFPNPYDTYIHDTPTQPMFNRPVRAFSHGCMRVHQARDFARTVLTHAGQWNEARFNALYEDWRGMGNLLQPYSPVNYERAIEKAAEIQTTLDLQTTIPVHVEYYTARVDDDGVVHFLTDVYGYDELAIHPSPPRRCIPETRAARHGLDAVPDAVAKIEADAQGLNACLAKLPDTRAALAALSPPAPAKLTAAAEALASFTTQHRAYADQVRTAQATLVADLAARGGSWRPALQERAVSVQRMLRGLRDMAKQAKATCAKLDAATKR
jgi:murein L,D-transpeptidase YcbB/YkuD